MRIPMKKLVKAPPKTIPLAERMANNLDLGIEDPMYAEEAIIPKHILKLAASELRRLSALENRKTVTVWASPAINDFVKDKTLGSLTTQLRKTKCEDNPVALNIEQGEMK
jgi:hypothetical protein